MWYSLQDDFDPTREGRLTLECWHETLFSQDMRCVKEYPRNHFILHQQKATLANHTKPDHENYLRFPTANLPHFVGR